MEPLWLGNSVASTKQTAPGLPDDIVVILDPKVLEQVVEFGEEERDGPEGPISHLLWEVSGLADPELIVHDYGDGVRDCQEAHRADVVVGCSWSAMETDKRPDARLEVSENGVPLKTELE